MDADELLARARARCANDRNVSGFCRACYVAELELMIGEEHPELAREAIAELIRDWMAAAHDLPQ